MKKCDVSLMFNTKSLAECLDSLGVKNEIIEGAILVDTEALAKIKKYEMPHLVFMNYDWLMK